MACQRRKQNNKHMKKLVGLVSIVFLLLSSTMEAQEKKERQRRGPDLTTEQMATLRTKKMALALDLDDQQQKAVYALVKEQADARKAKMATFKEKRKEGTQLTSDEKFQMQSDMLDQQLKNKAAMKKILSKEQFEKFEKASHRNKQAMHKKMESRKKGKREHAKKSEKNKS
jgi:hypothetical protein